MALSSIKAMMKNVRWIASANAWWKTWQTKNTHTNTIRYYAGKSLADTFETMLAKHLVSSNVSFNKPGRGINIFYLGADELQDRSGILQSLERIARLSYFIQSDGAYGQHIAGTCEQNRSINAARLLELFSKLHQAGETPDVLITQTFASYIDPGVFSQIRRAYGTIVVNIAMDDRHQYWGNKVNGAWGGTYGLIPHIDLALTAAPESVDWYLKEGCPAIFFPEASDPAIFHPMPDLPKMYEVCFVGRRYGIREEIVLALREAGIKVIAYGDGWENGHIKNEDVPALFAQSKIILGIGTIGHSADFYALKMRDFDGPMSGSCYVTHDNADLRLVYEVGKEIVTYRTAEECVEKIRFYLHHDVERVAIAIAGHARAVRDHSWGNRFGMMFDLLNEAIAAAPNATGRSRGGSA
jgi:spore maturation protein CgeB